MLLKKTQNQLDNIKTFYSTNKYFNFRMIINIIYETHNHIKYDILKTEK